MTQMLAAAHLHVQSFHPQQKSFLTFISILLEPPSFPKDMKNVFCNFILLYLMAFNIKSFHVCGELMHICYLVYRS